MPPDKGSPMPPPHRWHAEMGEGRLNRSPPPLGAQSRTALNTDVGGQGFKKGKDEQHRFVISNRYDTTFN